MHSPCISVILPVFNGAPYLHAAIESILNQTFIDFELLIIDDGSTDSSLYIASSYSDSRIRLDRNTHNIGLVSTLNKGLELARGAFIARMDADDFSFPDRLEKQLRFMVNHPEVGICGTAIEKVDERGSKIVIMPESHHMICFFMLFDNPFAHNTTMFRSSLIRKHGLTYDHNFKHSEDYELWDRCGQITQLANIPDALVRYNYHPLNTSNKYRHEQGRMAAKIRHRILLRLDPAFSEEELHLHNKIVNFEALDDFDTLIRSGEWLTRIVDIGRRKWNITENIAWPLVSRFWYGACGRLAGHGWQTWRLFRSSPLGRAAAFEWQWKLLLRCALRRSIP